jgi:hypothetical protein
MSILFSLYCNNEIPQSNKALATTTKKEKQSNVIIQITNYKGVKQDIERIHTFHFANYFFCCAEAFNLM